MKVRITKWSGHPVYGENGMYGKLVYGFRELGHEVVESGEELLIVPGSSADLATEKTNGKRIWWSHGVNWARGFENEDNNVLKSNFDTCDFVAYQSEFARYMVSKAFGVKEGPIVWNTSIPMLPLSYAPYEGELRLVCCSIWRAWKRLHEIERLVRESNHIIHLSVIGKDPRDNCPFDLPKSGPNYEIEYLGMMDIYHMREVYHTSHIGIHLAFNDYSPASVTEMMACGLPVIVTDSGGSKDIVQSSGIVLDTDPFVDTSFNIHSEGALPKVNSGLFESALDRMTKQLNTYREMTRDWVLSEANATTSAKKLFELSGL